jgi:hypothetical protein
MPSSAVTAGYMEDAFVTAFLKNAPRREPMINRGTFTRFYGINTLARNFTRKYKQNCQIVSLGAGNDTLWFNLKRDAVAPKLYVEIDFSQITSRKAMAIYRNRLTKSMLSPDAKIGINP